MLLAIFWGAELDLISTSERSVKGTRLYKRRWHLEHMRAQCNEQSPTWVPYQPFEDGHAVTATPSHGRSRCDQSRSPRLAPVFSHARIFRYNGMTGGLRCVVIISVRGELPGVWKISGEPPSLAQYTARG